MAAEPCKKCGKLRKIDIIVASDGWHQPPCYRCGDPGYIEPLNPDERPETVIVHMDENWNVSVYNKHGRINIDRVSKEEK